MSGLCDFCKSATEKCESGEVGKAERRTYKRYATMLPLSARFGVGARKKFCFENADRLLFVVGKKKYFFDKLNITDTGRISKPEKRQ